MDKIYVQSNVELNISIAKNVFLIIFIYYTNFKITNKKIELNCKFIIDNFIIIIFGIICAMIKNKISFAISIISSILIISLIFSKDMTTKSIITTIISYAINYTIFCITIIVSFIFNMITKLNNDYMNFVVILITHILVLYHFCKIKRFKNGFLFLKNKNNNEYIDILILNIGIMILYIIATIIHYDIVIGRELITIVTTVIPIMFVTIKKSLQLYYKQKLLIQDLNETKEELEKTKSD